MNVKVEIKEIENRKIKEDQQNQKLSLWNGHKIDKPLEKPIKDKRRRAKVIMLQMKRNTILKSIHIKIMTVL